MNYEIKSQLSIVVENTPGTIAALSDILSAHDVSLSALTITEDADKKGRFRFTCCDPVAAKRSLEAAGHKVEVDEVLSISMQDRKGKLAFLTKIFCEGGINIDYMYASVNEAGTGSRLIVKVCNIHLAVGLLDEILIAA